MTRQRAILKGISVVVAVVFLWTNCIWAEGMFVNKLASQSHAGQVGQGLLRNPELGRLVFGAGLLDELGIHTLADIVAKMEELEERGVICFVRSDDNGREARYVFGDNGVILRITKKGKEVNDDFYQLIRLRGEKEPVGDDMFEWIYITVDSVELINEFLTGLNKKWVVSSVIDDIKIQETNLRKINRIEDLFTEEKLREIIDRLRKGEIKLEHEDLDVINKDGVVVGQLDRAIIHEYGFLHRTANVFILTPDGRIVLQRRAHHKKAQPLKLSIYGGHVSAGSNYEDTIKEEIKEELGLPEDYELQGRLVRIGEEGEFRSPPGDTKNREKRSLYVYLPTEWEFRELDTKAKDLQDRRKNSSRAEFEAYLLAQPKGRGEVWGVYYFDSLDSLKDGGGRIVDTFIDEEATEYVGFTSDLLLPLVQDDNTMNRLRDAIGILTSKNEIKSHLFPRYIHDAIGVQLNTLRWERQRIETVLTKGTAYYDEQGDNIVVDNEAVGVIAQVLTEELSKKARRDISSDNVKNVLLLHERLHQVIKKKSINVIPLLSKLRDYYAEQLNKSPDSQEVTEAVNTLLCNFSRNYNYLPDVDLANNSFINLSEAQQFMLISEMLVHEYVERHFFRQPVRVIDLSENRRDLPKEIERIFFRGLTPRETVELFGAIFNIEDDLMLNYFLMLYGLYLDPKADMLKMEETFVSSALMNERDRKEKLGAVDYRELLIKETEYRKSAKGVRLILNPMDGGVGSETVREGYLRKRNRWKGKPGSKGGDLYIDIGPDNDINIMEAKLLRALMEVQRGDYRSIEYQMLGSSESAESFEEVLDLPCRMPDARRRSYREYITAANMNLVPVQLGIKVPAVDKKAGWLTTENVGHGNHGIRGAYFFQEALTHDIEGEGTVIRTIYNGDGINNGVDPVIVGWMAEERVPVVMITTTKQGIDKKGGMIGIQIVSEGRGYKVQIMELAQAKTTGQEQLFYDVGLEVGERDQQYFNTNTVLMNISALQGLLNDLLERVGKDKFLEIMAPVLITNPKEDGKYLQLEGALGSVVLALAGYFETEAVDILEKYGISKFLRIVNVDKHTRSKFFTPLKKSEDYWFLFHSDRFRFNRATVELEDIYPEKPMPSFDLVDGGYKDVQNLIDWFKGGSVKDLGMLEILRRPVLLNNIILRGRVSIFNISNKILDLNTFKRQLIEYGIQEAGGKLVLENVSIVMDENDIFVSKVTEGDGDLGARYFARQIYLLKDSGKVIPSVLSKITEMLSFELVKPASLEDMADSEIDKDVEGYIRSIATGKNPKYGVDGKARYFDGVTTVASVPDSSGISRLFMDLISNITRWQEGTLKRRLLANVALGAEHLTVCNGVAMDNWKAKYDNELNSETKKEIDARAEEFEGSGLDKEDSMRQAVYEVVSERILEALKGFSAWKRPVFKLYRISAFPSGDTKGKVILILTMVPATAEDIAVVTKMRDAIQEKTGIGGFEEFKGYIALGYFVDRLNNREERRKFKKLMSRLNQMIEEIVEDRDYWFELPSIEVSFFTDMDSFPSLRSFSWIDGNHNRTAGIVVRGELYGRIRELQTTRQPKAGPIGKEVTAGAGYSELWQAEVKNGKVSGGVEVGIGKGHPKFNKIEMNLLEGVISRLSSEYGPGILAVVDVIRIVDNILPSVRTTPYAMVTKEDGRNILLLDVDVFSDEQLLYIVLEHELKEGIMTIIPYENEAVRELTANYMSLKLALEKGIKIDKAKLSELGADLQFFEALELLQAMSSVTDEDIIAVAIEHMRAMPYYAELFKEFSFAGEWRDRIKDAEDRYRTALRIFNDTAEAKEMTVKVKEAAVKVDAKIKGLSDSIRKIRMVVSTKVRWELDFIDALVGNNKYIMLDRAELAKPENRYISDWIEKMSAGREKSPFIYSNEPIPNGVNPEDVIYLIEPADVKEGMPNDKLYLPLPYSIGSTYLASQVVIAGGRVSDITDKLVLNTIMALYETLLGREITEEELEQLFRVPWQVLPPIAKISAILDVLRKATQQIEKAA